jgi:hypothetical protein
LELVLRAIQTGRWNERIEEVRHQTDTEKRNDIKMQLPAFMPAGVFNPEQKSVEDLIHFSGIVHFDFDKETTSSKSIAYIKKTLSPHIVFIFKSPSGGNKYKVGILVDRDIKDNHGYRNVWEHLSKDFPAKPDIGAKNINRQCSISYDPDCYINLEATPYIVPPEIDTKPFDLEAFLKSRANSKDMVFKNRKQMIEKCCEWTEKKVGDFAMGNRNNYIFKLSIYLNMFGVSLNDAIDLILERIKYSKMDRKEVYGTIESVYKRYRKSHGCMSMSQGLYVGKNKRTDRLV